MKEMSSAEIQKDWELWLEERKAIKVNRSIQDTNGTLSTTSTIINGSINDIGNNDDYDDDDIENIEDRENLEDNREPSIVNSPITTDSDDILEAIASLFGSSQEDLISTITEGNLDREEMVIPSVQKQLLKRKLRLFIFCTLSQHMFKDLVETQDLKSGLELLAENNM
ncbi:hypothetical protein Glove_203g40 [Diversispora epigaea]|uniref:Uncharacterized protein n=1 Tax=Diversispora epigaea TaxID=1348612 RepID=A0A397IJN5_9GLOM|nr:hypothetical protein Glove_203g40 [Diversispora epigaea]